MHYNCIICTISTSVLHVPRQNRETPQTHIYSWQRSMLRLLPAAATIGPRRQLSTASCRCNPTHNAYLTLHARLLLAGVALAPVLCNPQAAGSPHNNDAWRM